ncbi:MAG: tetratricopeptide repeat protein, partial [Candidatus Latescibacteria bacterium]|nr:tetratricopeptide repeat protein [Candidatus Latescibacterota bacterium]
MFDRAPKLEKAFRRYPQTPLFARLADHFLRRGRLMQAQALCEEGCERFPAYPTGFIVLSRCFERQRMWEEARIALDRSLRLDPDNPAAYRR